MKLHKIFKTLGLIAILFVLIATPLVAVSAAGFRQESAPVVSDTQLYVIGLIATVIVYILKQFTAQKIVIKRGPLTIGLFVLSWALAVGWSGIHLPVFASFSDPVSFVSAVFAYLTGLLVAIGPSFTFATLIYNVFLKKVLDEGVKKLSEVN